MNNYSIVFYVLICEKHNGKLTSELCTLNYSCIADNSTDALYHAISFHLEPYYWSWEFLYVKVYNS